MEMLLLDLFDIPFAKIVVNVDKNGMKDIVSCISYDITMNHINFNLEYKQQMYKQL